MENKSKQIVSAAITALLIATGLVSATSSVAQAADRTDPIYKARNCDEHDFGVDHSNCNHQGRTLADGDYHDSNFSGANMAGANLAFTNFEGTNFSNAILTDINFSYIVRWRNGRESGSYEGDLWRMCTAPRERDCLSLGARLKGVNLEGADLTGSDLSRITSGSITGTPKALPRGFKLANGYLIGPNAIITGANLQGADLSGSDVDLTGIISGKITGTPKLPAGWAVYKGYLIGPGANMYDADLSGANLNSFDFKFSNLTQVRSGGITGNPKLPSGCKLIKGYILCKNVNLLNANLKGADLSGVDIEHSYIKGLRSGAIVNGPSQLPEEVAFINGYIIGPEVNLSNENLGNANLTGAYLKNANLHKTNLAKAKLAEVRSGGISGNPIMPSGFRLIKGYIVGPKVHLEHADLTGSDLTGLSLAGVYLSNANLTGAKIDVKNDGVLLAGMAFNVIGLLPKWWRLERKARYVYALRYTKK